MSPPSTPDRIRVLIVDDDLFVREILSDYLAAADLIEVVGTCADGAEAVARVRADPPDVVLMDLQMAGMDGLEATRRIREHSDSTRVLVLTSFGDDEAIADVIAAGAAGFLLKDTRPSQLAAAIRTAHGGITVMPPQVVQRWSGAHRSGAPAMTVPERQVLDHLASGLTNREIAEAMFVSASTVKNHLVSLRTKLDARSRTGIVDRAHVLGMFVQGSDPSARP